MAHKVWVTYWLLCASSALPLSWCPSHPKAAQGQAGAQLEQGA